MAEIRLEGFEELAKMIEDKFSPEQVAKALGKPCALVEKAAKENAPKGNGDLRRSITSKVEVEGKEAIGTVFTPLEYAPYVEYGTGLFAEVAGRKDVPWHYQDDEGEWHSTSGQHPHPYMRPALDDNIDRVKELIMEGILNG